MPRQKQTDPPSPTTYAKATAAALRATASALHAMAVKMAVKTAVKRLRRTGRKQTMKLQEAIKGMEVESWELREHSSGKRKVYVRFVPKKPIETMSVKEVE